MVSGLLNDKRAQHHAGLKMKGCLRHSLTYVLSVAFNFTVHFKIVVCNSWKGKKKVNFFGNWQLCKKEKASPTPPCVASYLALGRSWLIPKRRVSACSITQQSFPSGARESSPARTFKVRNDTALFFPRQPWSLLIFICRASGNHFCQTNQQLSPNVEGYL